MTSKAVGKGLHKKVTALEANTRQKTQKRSFCYAPNKVKQKTTKARCGPNSNPPKSIPTLLKEVFGQLEPS